MQFEAEAATGYRANLAALKSAQKPPRGTAAYSRLVNRPAARRVAAAAASAGLTPNGATAISAIFSFAGLVLLATLEPTWPVAIAIAALLALGYVWDSVDGQLARLTGAGSVSGEWLDHTVDTFKTSSLHLAVLISWYRFPPVDDRVVLLIPLGFEIAQMATFFGIMTMPFLRKQHASATHAHPSATPAAEPPEHPLRTWLLIPMDYGFLCWTFVLLAWPVAFVVTYSALFAIRAVLLSAALRKWWRELRALDAARRSTVG